MLLTAPPRTGSQNSHDENYRFLPSAKLYKLIWNNLFWDMDVFPLVSFTYMKLVTTAPQLSRKSQAEVFCSGKRSTISSFFTSPPLRPQSRFFAVFSKPAGRILQNTGPHVKVFTVPWSSTGQGWEWETISLIKLSKLAMKQTNKNKPR